MANRWSRVLIPSESHRKESCHDEGSDPMPHQDIFPYFKFNFHLELTFCYWWKRKPSYLGLLSSFFFFFFFFKDFFFLKIYLLIVSLLCWVFVSVLGFPVVAASGGYSSSRCAGLSLLRPLLLRSTGSRRAGSVVVAHGPSCSAACGIFPDQGANPCPLH